MVEHIFGGDWTEVKLNVLRQYLQFYTTAFKNQPFKSIYIDAFAGTGERQRIIPAAPIFNEDEKIETLAGSAKIALETKNPFDKYIFIEKVKQRLDRLRDIAEGYPDRDVEFHQGDANFILYEICDRFNWKQHRAVLFLDPYGLEVDWNTLEKIRTTKAIDVWFLFSISGLYRQAALKFDSIEDYKINTINRILGTDDWQKIFYQQQETDPQEDLFKEQFIRMERTASVSDLELYIKNRLEELFPYVSDSLPLYNRGVQLYSLFLCVSNPSPKAIGLAKRVAKFILKTEQ
jgi:three-Cys-motif partner protein